MFPLLNKNNNNQEKYYLKKENASNFVSKVCKDHVIFRWAPHPITSNFFSPPPPDKQNMFDTPF